MAFTCCVPRDELMLLLQVVEYVKIPIEIILYPTELKNDCACVTYDPVSGTSWRASAGKSRLKQQIPNVKSITEWLRYFVDFYMTMRVFTLQNALFIFVGLRLVVLIAETFERLRILFILSTIIVP